MAFKVTMAGQDISLLVKEMSIQVQDTLGQGAGVAVGSSGRATTCSFLMSGVGPASGAIGAGTSFTQSFKNLLTQNQSSIDTDTTGFGQNGGGVVAITRDTTEHWQGAASLKVVTDGVAQFQGAFSLIPWTSLMAGGTYTFSVYLKGTAGQQITLVAQGSAGGMTAAGAGVTLAAEWIRASVTFTLPNPLPASGSLSVNVQTGAFNHAYTWYEDGLQVEQGASATAWTYGGVPQTPKLVRLSDVQIFDSTGAAIFGGKAVMLEDQTIKKVNYVKVSCVDWWQFLETIVVNKVYTSQTDLAIIQDLLTTYATWVAQDLLPASGSITLSVENYNHFTLRKALQRITDKSGYNIWIDANKHIRYVDPTKSPTAPFSLSDTPNFTSSFQCGVDDYTLDDTSAVNRVYFYGGKSLSNDLTQVLTPQANGSNDLFVLAYYPHKSSDGSFHLKVNGVDKNLGFVGGTGASNTLVANGGTANALLNIDAHTIQWDTASIPTGAQPVTFIFRREIPLLVVVADNASVSYFGSYLDGVISDQSVFDQSIAVKRCRTLLYEQSFGLETLQIKCWKPGILAGQIIRVDHTVRNIHKSFIVQSVTATPKGAGFFEYTLTLGAWHINLVDAVVQLARLATPDDDSSTESQSVVSIQSLSPNVGMHLATTTSTRTMGGYFPRLTPAGDGTDAYPGLFSI